MAAGAPALEIAPMVEDGTFVAFDHVAAGQYVQINSYCYRHEAKDFS